MTLWQGDIRNKTVSSEQVQGILSYIKVFPFRPCIVINDLVTRQKFLAPAVSYVFGFVCCNHKT